MEFKIIKTKEDLQVIRKEWNDLVNNTDKYEVFYTYEWLECYINYYNSTLSKLLFILVGKEKERIICIFPFILNRGKISFITDEMTDYNNIYIDSNSNKYTVIKKALEYLFQNEEIEEFSLKNIKESSELYIFKDILSLNGFNTFLSDSGMIPLIQKGELETKFNKKQIKDIERRKKNIEKKSSLIFEKTTLTTEILDFILRNKAIKYNKEYNNESNEYNFLIHLSKYLYEYLHVTTLRKDGKIIAAHLGFLSKNKYYYYIPAYDMKESNSGLGLILLKHLIDQYKDSVIFDFLRGTENYKYYWSDNITTIFSLNAYNKSKKFKIIKNKLKNKFFLRILFNK